MKHFQNINIWGESKFVFYQYRRNEDDIWDEQTPVDKGTAAAEQIIKDFDVRTDPEMVSLNHPDEVIFGVRTRMAQDVFRGSGNNILGADRVHNERVLNRLRNIMTNAPETYRHIIDEEYRRRANAQTWRNPINRIRFALRSRRSIEEDIAEDFFSFNLGNQTFDQFRNNLYQQIRNLGDPKNGTFLDANNEPINLVNMNATNEYTVAVGAPGDFRNERVVVRWHEDDFFEIRSKLERAGLWAEFSRSTPNTPNNQRNRAVREFIHMKFRLSLIDKVAAEEKTKLNNDRFNAQRLKTWLDNDIKTQALYDPDMQTFINDNGVASYTSLEDLQNRNPDLHRQFMNKINELGEKNKEKTLQHYLSKILPPEELAHLHDSLEGRAMLAYLQGAAQDPEQGMNVREYLRRLAGVKQQYNIGMSAEQIKELEDGIELVNYFTSSDGLGKDNGNYIAAQAKANSLIGGLAAFTAGSKEYAAALKEVNEAEEKATTLRISLHEKMWSFIKLLHSKSTEAPYDVFCSFPHPDPAIGGTITNYLQSKNPNHPEDFIRDFNNFFGHIQVDQKLKDLQDALKKKKEEEVKKKPEEEVEPKQMDSRSLLTSLMKVDLKRHGITNPEELNKQGLFACNLAIARLENSEIYASVNQHIVDEYERGGAQTRFDSLRATKFFSPVLSATDAIEHVVDSDPDLAMFSEIAATSTRNDLRRIIDQYGVGPAKIKEFIAKLGTCIKGIEISPAGTSLFSRLPSRLARMFGFGSVDSERTLGVRMLSSEVPIVEKLINTLTLLSAEYITKNYYQEAREQAEIDPSKSFDEHYLDMIKQQTSDMREINRSIEDDLERPDNPLKTHLDFHRMRRRVNEALEEISYITDPQEYEAELRKRGIAPRELTRGILSLRTRRFFRRAARTGLTGLSLPFYIPYGIGIGIGKAASYWFKNILLSEGMKKGGKAWGENMKAFIETPQHIIGIPAFAVSMILSWPTKKFRELNRKLKE